MQTRNTGHRSSSTLVVLARNRKAPKVFADDRVALAMKHIFSQLETYDLDSADGLKELFMRRDMT